MNKDCYILWIAVLIFIFYLFFFAKKNQITEKFNSQEPSAATLQILPKGLVVMEQGDLIFRLSRKQTGSNKKLVLHDSLHNNDLDVQLLSHQRNEMISLIDGSRCVVYAQNGGFYGEVYRGEDIVSQVKFEEDFVKKDGEQTLTKVIIRDEVDNSEIAVVEKRRDYEWEILFNYGLDRNIIVLLLFFFYEMEKQNTVHQKYYGV